MVLKQQQYFVAIKEKLSILSKLIPQYIKLKMLEMKLSFTQLMEILGFLQIDT